MNPNIYQRAVLDAMIFLQLTTTVIEFNLGGKLYRRADAVISTLKICVVPKGITLDAHIDFILRAKFSKRYIRRVVTMRGLQHSF